jgi:HemK-like putative methylase
LKRSISTEYMGRKEKREELNCMPRIRPSLLRLAASESQLLPAVLRETRDLQSARNDLRWLREHAVFTARSQRAGSVRSQTTLSVKWRLLLKSYVERRGKGEPLQYIIGNQPFGELEILCEKDVLIPRPETEIWTQKFGHLVSEFLVSRAQNRIAGAREKVNERDVHKEEAPTGDNGLRVLDLCTGTGCIPLLLYEILSGQQVRAAEGHRGAEILGVDISTAALDLARKNLHHNISLSHLPKETAKDISFTQADVLESSSNTPKPHHSTDIPSLLDVLKSRGPLNWDIVTANPPYISPTHFSPSASGYTRTARSVRKYEPQLALVPSQSILVPPIWKHLGNVQPTRGDEFYYHILPLIEELDVRVAVMEVGDSEQAGRVAELARRMIRKACGESGERGAGLVEVWFDDGKAVAIPSDSNAGVVGLTKNMKRSLEVGSGGTYQDGEDVSARAVVVWRRDWAEWIESARRD